MIKCWNILEEGDIEVKSSDSLVFNESVSQNPINVMINSDAIYEEKESFFIYIYSLNSRVKFLEHSVTIAVNDVTG